MLAALLGVLGVLAAVSALACELPWQASCPLAIAALAHGGALARRELRRAVREVVIPHGAAEATIDGQPMLGLVLHWRGPLAFLRWRSPDGRRASLQGWPDNLGLVARRELRLAVAARVPVRTRRSVAP